uniref:Uncharacterized protein n=1 Tax=Nelumbo nucifera TaxID=4432 RepID=A0A822YAE7_NELNU|nr:TPA_asm: hypothetical protein HUJ06_030855 [Nelumbo nucifera]
MKIELNGWVGKECVIARCRVQIYFPHSRFLEASLGSKPSWALRSLLDGRALLCKGLIWRIGNGLTARKLTFGMMCGSQIFWKVE